MIGNDIIEPVRQPQQWRTCDEGPHQPFGVSDFFQDKQHRATGFELTPIGGQHMQGLLASLIEGGRHRWRRARLKRDRDKSIMLILSFEPNDNAVSKTSIPIPDDPVLMTTCITSVIR